MNPLTTDLTSPSPTEVLSGDDLIVAPGVGSHNTPMLASHHTMPCPCGNFRIGKNTLGGLHHFGKPSLLSPEGCTSLEVIFLVPMDLVQNPTYFLFHLETVCLWLFFFETI